MKGNTITVRVRKEKGGRFFFGCIEKVTILPLLKSRVYSEIRVKTKDVTCDEVDWLVRKGLIAPVDGDSREIMFRLEED